MPFHEALAERIRRALVSRRDIEEKKMFGGVAFMLGGKMFCGIVGEDLMVRVGPSRYEEGLSRAHVRPMDFTGKPMRGYASDRVTVPGDRGDRAGRFPTTNRDRG